MHVSPYIWTRTNHQTEIQATVPESCNHHGLDLTALLFHRAEEMSKNSLTWWKEKQRNGEIGYPHHHSSPRWIHTSVIFAPMWTGIVYNTPAPASGVRRPNSCCNCGCYTVGCLRYTVNETGFVFVETEHTHEQFLLHFSGCSPFYNMSLQCRSYKMMKSLCLFYN